MPAPLRRRPLLDRCGAPRAAHREPAADRARRAAARRGAQRGHGRDRRRQDGARPRARPAAGRQAPGRASCGRARPRPTSRASSSCRRGCSTLPSSADLRERLDGATRARSSSPAGSARRGARAPTSAGARPRRPTCASWAGGWWPSSASTSTAGSRVASAQLELLDGFCGPRPGSAARRAWRPRTRSSASAPRELEALRARAGARDRDLDLLAVRDRGDRGAGALRGGGDGADRPSASGCARSTGCGPPPAPGARPSPPTSPEQAGAALLLAQAERRGGGGRAGPIPRSTAARSAWRALRIEAEDLGGRAAALPLVARRRPGAPAGGRGAPGRPRPRQAQARRHGRVRCSSMPSAAEPSATGSRTPRRRSSGRRRRWRRPRASAPRVAGELSTGAQPAAAPKLAKAVRGGAGLAGHGGRLVLGRARAARGDRRHAARSGSSSCSRPTRACPRRRCATPRPVASSRA